MEVGKIVVDFEVIPTHNPKRLWVSDMSSWSVSENQASVIEITPPGSSISINHAFVKHNLNIFHSINLGLSCLAECAEQEYQNLPDGIWTLTVKSAFTGLEKTRYYLKEDVFQLELDQIYIRAGLEFDRSKKGFRDDLQDMEFLIRSAHAQVRNGDFFKADRDFTQAQELLDKYKNCKNCI